jgi:hypothetical protein
MAFLRSSEVAPETQERSKQTCLVQQDSFLLDPRSIDREESALGFYRLIKAEPPCGTVPGLHLSWHPPLRCSLTMALNCSLCLCLPPNSTAEKKSLETSSSGPVTDSRTGSVPCPHRAHVLLIN